MIKLRPYQGGVVAKVRELHTACLTPLVVMPTGTGKTRTFAAVIQERGVAAVAVVHRNEILTQISEALGDLGVVHRIVGASKAVAACRRKHLKKFGKSYVDQQAAVGVASAQTLTSAATARNKPLMAWIRDQVQLAVYDEGHHYTKGGSWEKAVTLVENADLLVVTACPERADGKGLGSHADGFCDELVQAEQDGEVVTTEWAIRNGYLSKFQYYAPETNLDVAGIARTKAGDFNAKALRARTVESDLVGDLIDHYASICPGKRAVGFASDVATADEMAAEARARGFKAISLSGNTDAGERDRAVTAFTDGQYDILFNVGLFDEGFDVPAVECVLMGSPTMSLNRFLQMIGRGLRMFEGKEFAYIIDPVRNWERHGMPDWQRKWTLSGAVKNMSGPSDTVPQRVCRACTRPYEAFYVACPYCGHENVPPERSTPGQVDGDLMLLDTEALAALFAKKEKANASEDEFRSSLYKPNENGKIMPPAYHNAAVKRHRAAVYRRSVLDNIIGWWLGAVSQRMTKREAAKLFHLRFNVDLITAYTLGERETDDLIDLIRKKFGADVK